MVRKQRMRAVLLGIMLIASLAACGDRHTVSVDDGTFSHTQEDRLHTEKESQGTEESERAEVSRGSTEISQDNDAQPQPKPEETQEQPQPEETQEQPRIHLVMVGDMLMHMTVVNSGRKSDGTYNYDHLFAQVGGEIAAADVAIVNQETIFGGKELGYSGYPTFNSPCEVGDAEAKAGFDVILQGTNHALDKGSKGVLNCIDFWESNYPQISYLGINASQEQQDNDIYVYEKDGLKIAILNYTYGTNGIRTPSGMPYLVNYMDEGKVKADIARAKELADFVVVCPHWGTEYKHDTDSYQQKWTKIFLENGVGLVIGTHPHVIEPVEWVSDDKGNKMLVYYSLGNFVNGTSSSGKVADRMVGGMADVTIGMDGTGKAAITDYDVIPLVCHIAEGTDYTVYYLSDYTQELADSNKIKKRADNFSLEYCQSLVEKVWAAKALE